MKLSEARPCDSCGGVLLTPPIGCFYVIKVSQAIMNPKAANQVLGLTQMFQGHLGLAEVMSPVPNDAIMILGEKEPELMREIFLCFECYTGNISLAEILEKGHDKRKI